MSETSYEGPSSAEELYQVLPAETHYLIFYASPLSRGRHWCRDCEAAEPVIVANISPLEGTVIYVGQRDEWNEPSNPWRQAPFNVERVPTILKVQPGDATVPERIAKAKHIVEADILFEQTFKAFLQS